MFSQVDWSNTFIQIWIVLAMFAGGFFQYAMVLNYNDLHKIKRPRLSIFIFYILTWWNIGVIVTIICFLTTSNKKGKKNV